MVLGSTGGDASKVLGTASVTQWAQRLSVTLHYYYYRPSPPPRRRNWCSCDQKHRLTAPLKSNPSPCTPLHPANPAHYPPLTSPRNLSQPPDLSHPVSGDPPKSPALRSLPLSTVWDPGLQHHPVCLPEPLPHYGAGLYPCSGRRGELRGVPELLSSACTRDMEQTLGD